MKRRSFRVLGAGMVLLLPLLLSGCLRKEAGPPGDLIYVFNPVHYIKGLSILPNIATSGGGFITSYSVSPTLPTGLQLDTKTGEISGTPTTLTPSFIYTVTGINNHGSTTVDLVITIDDSAPVISYAPSPNIVQVSLPLSMSPTNLGGVANSYSITPPLPAGLVLNLTSGIISGTPINVTSPTVYTITAANSGGNSQFQLTLGIKGPFWLVDGNFGGALAMLALNNVLYLGGSFQFVGPYRGHGGILDTAGTMPVGMNYPVVDGYLNTAVPDPLVSGAYYIGGKFQTIGATLITHMAHILANGSVDNSFNVSSNGEVTALLVNGTTLYVAGNFTSIGGVARVGLAAFDLNTGLPTTFMNSLAGVTGGSVKAMAINTDTSIPGTFLYIGGTFTGVNGSGRASLAAVDATLGSTNATWNPGVTGAGISVNAMVSSGTKIYIGGSFANVTGSPVANLASLTADSPATLNPGTPDVNKPGGTPVVNALAATAPLIFVGGDFSDLGGIGRDGGAALTAGTGALDTTWVPQVTGAVQTITVNGGSVYLGGSFNKVQGLFRSNFAVVNNTDASLNSVNPGFADRVRAIAVPPASSRMFVGGDFGSFAMTPRSNAAAIDPTTGQVLGWDPGVNKTVFCMAASGSNIYLGGDFADVGGNIRHGLAIVDTTGNLNTTWNASLDNATEVRTMVLNGSDLYVGGSFTNMGSQAFNTNNLAKVDADPTHTGVASTVFVPNPDGPINALALVGTTLFIGGGFLNVGNPLVQPIRNAAQIDATNLSTGTASVSWAPDPDNVVRAIATHTANNITTIYLAGDFATLKGGSQPRGGVVSINTAGNVNTAFNANMSGGSGYALALSASGNELFVAGTFTSLNAGRNGLGGVNATNGTADLVFNPGLGQPNARSVLTFGSNTVFVGGDFSSIQNGSKYTTGFGALTLSGSPLR